MGDAKIGPFGAIRIKQSIINNLWGLFGCDALDSLPLDIVSPVVFAHEWWFSTRLPWNPESARFVAKSFSPGIRA